MTEQQIRAVFGSVNHLVHEQLIYVQIEVLGEIAAQLCRANDLKEMELRGGVSA